MQRIVSRSQFLAVESAGTHDSAYSRTGIVLSAIALVLSCCGLASAADPDNVLLDFTATWCGPCQQMSSIVSRLERQGYSIRKVDVDQESALASKYRVDSIPCFVLVADGQELERVSGITTEQQLRSMLNRLPKTPAVAKIAGSSRSDGAKLGPAVPLTLPSGNSKPPRLSLPLHTGDQDRELAAEEVPADFRGQTPVVDPMLSSVRIRVKDGSSINFGSGTIIESQAGHATVLSCGHMFRNLSKNAVIEVDHYQTKNGKPETVTGRVLLNDLEADVGLVTITCSQKLLHVPLGLSRPLAAGERLFSIGCSGGAHPSRENVELTSINRYKGPENLECTNRPQKGRSGGGLFRDDELVGVCIAADPKVSLGLYTGLQPIGLLLEKAGLSSVAPRILKIEPTDGGLLAGLTDSKANSNPPATREQTPLANADEDIARILGRELADNGTGTVPDEFAGAEIICIVRSKTPGKPSRVVIVNQASESFIADLLHESGGDSARLTADRKTAPRGPIETSFEPKPFRRQQTK